MAPNGKHLEKFIFRGLQPGGADLVAKIDVVKGTVLPTKARLAATWALSRGISCNNVDFKSIDLSGYGCPHSGIFNGSRFAKASFEKAQFENCSFAGCLFAACWFQLANFVGCDFAGSIFERSNLDYGTFDQCDFSNCQFDRCSFESAVFADCNLNNVSFAEEEVTRSDFEQTISSWLAEIPQLIDALRDGHFDGGGHLDLRRTLHRLRGSRFKPPFVEVPPPAELWMANIGTGDKAGDPSPAGYFAARAIEWADAVLQRSAAHDPGQA